jgi:hypothetical protein
MAKIATTFEDVTFRPHRAFRAAKAADHLTRALLRPMVCGRSFALEGATVERAAAMLLRTAVLLEICAEKKGWPDRIVGLPDREPNAAARAAAEAVFDEVDS